MSALAHMKSLSTFGGKVGDAIKQAEQAISDNEYLSPQSAKWVRAGLWVAGAAGIIGGATMVLAAPIAAAVIAGAGTAVGVAGSYVERVANEKEQVRAAHAQFLESAKSFMADIKVEYQKTKADIKKAEAFGYQSTDYIQYKEAHDHSKSAALKSSASLELSIPESKLDDVAGAKKEKMRFG